MTTRLELVLASLVLVRHDSEGCLPLISLARRSIMMLDAYASCFVFRVCFVQLFRCALPCSALLHFADWNGGSVFVKL